MKSSGYEQQQYPGGGRNEPCKGCDRQYDIHISDAKMARLVEIASRSRTTVGDEEYERRLAICLACPDLQYGTTCRHCGCLVQVRAKLAESTCPYPYASQWA
ncbi:hypothetical protein GCM10008014_58460 [Paenibacillus silvae]|uniref:Uncharacterized protein n=1 Tax=Paenibacillus silvae TaxID=1325358 RepID=A0ABQ1ZNI3_9BACL|nr:MULTISPECIES: DUF6171 family protein [Paenibacillus]GGH72269.1 hypothetical protein GCM10008014_58460 [Paenibacillus silvae]